jgi:hypothetical protein
MNDSNNHHYLPKFYLRKWVADDQKITKYYRLYDNRLIAGPAFPKKEGSVPGLYALSSVKPEYKNHIETKFFKQIDDKAAKLMRRFIRGERFSLDTEMASSWAMFLMAFTHRTPARLESLAKISEKELDHGLTINPEEYELLRSPSEPPTLKEWLQINAPRILQDFHIRMLPTLINSEKIGNALMEMHWIVRDVSKANTQLIIGDNPFYISDGLGKPNTYVFLPLGPRSIFIASRNKTIIEHIKKAPATRLVKEVNRIMVQTADRLVYSTYRTHKVLVEKWLKKV